MAGNKFAEDYIDVAARLVEFRTKHPDGSLQAVNPAEPIKVIIIGDATFLQYVAYAFRDGKDPRPGVGTAWEPFPGKTPFTKDSEAMVAETSAWGRAIVAALAADTKRGVASADEVRARQSTSAAQPPGGPAPSGGNGRLSDRQATEARTLLAALPDDKRTRAVDWMGGELGCASVDELSESDAERLLVKLRSSHAQLEAERPAEPEIGVPDEPPF